LECNAISFGAIGGLLQLQMFGTHATVFNAQNSNGTEAEYFQNAAP